MKVNTDGILLGAWAPVEKDTQILDIGTGTGIIAIMMAQRNAQAIVHAVEKDQESAEEAKVNILSCPWYSRIQVFHQCFLNYTHRYRGTLYDHIISNPPFFKGGTISETGRKNKGRHTMEMGHQEMLLACAQMIREGGKISVILPLTEGQHWLKIARNNDFYPLRITEVRSKSRKPVERLLITLSKTFCAVSTDQLVIMEEGDSRIYTEEYRKLTMDFYLHF
ncbi:MAG TPA: methyltransferase [Saprospiraceae bacterium]|nr:methyltransferase [Saprospiraceae bacterium]